MDPDGSHTQCSLTPSRKRKGLALALLGLVIWLGYAYSELHPKPAPAPAPAWTRPATDEYLRARQLNMLSSPAFVVPEEKR